MSFLGRIWRVRILGASLGGAAVLFIAGIIFWGGFNTAMEATNTMTFCISCHEMKDNVYEEYKQTVHYQNRSGVRAVCSDCHVPDPWVHKVVRKIKASKELFHKVMGTVNTPEKFEAHRLTMAKREWARMKETDSRECRNCHSWSAMTDKMQARRAWKMHTNAQQDGQTCIDCHKGIAHRDVSVLLTAEDDPYDGQPDPRRLPPKGFDEAKVKAEAEAAAKAMAAKAAAGSAPAQTPQPASAEAAATPAETGAAGGGIDWAAIPAKEVTLLYPGQTSWEWVLQGSDHGGARIFKKGDSCSGCHEGEQADMGQKMASGEKAEPTPIPGKRPAIPLTVQAAHDSENLYMRFTWPASEHTPAPFVDGGKMDPDNEVKLAMMIDAGKVEAADRSGCWSTCHHDVRSMPDAPDGQEVSKYLPQTRTELEIRGGDGIPRGGWDKLKSPEEIKALMDEGVFLDLVRFNSGDGSAEDGYVLDKRVMDDGDNDVSFTAERDGDNWIVTMTRKLAADGPGDVTLEQGKTYTVGFAIHDDFTDARFHHVSIDYALGIGEVEADIKAVPVADGGGAAAAPAGGAEEASQSGGALDWSGAAAKEVTLLYPGQTSWEWVLQGSDHGGARIFKKGDSCSGCHEGEQADMGQKMASGEKAEPTPIPGKRPAIPLTVQALYDDENLYMRFSWPEGEHTPAPFADGGKMDPDNEVKLAMMIDAGKVEAADRSGCWSTCHHDVRSMPDAPDGQEVSKYLPQTRTELEIRGGDGIPRGGWDKLKSPEEIKALMDEGVFLDLVRFNSGDGSAEDGYVLDKRVMNPASGVEFSGHKENGAWIVEMVRKLEGDEPGDVTLEEGKVYTVGFAIHDDHTDARFHHVSIDYSLALGAGEGEADIVAARR